MFGQNSHACLWTLASWKVVTVAIDSIPNLTQICIGQQPGDTYQGTS